MKIQSRPAIDTTPSMCVDEMTVMMRDVLECEGVATSDMYRKVLTLGACSLLKQQGYLADYQVSVGGRGYYDIEVSAQLPDGEYVRMSL